MSALTRERVRAVLTGRLPNDPKWATWIEGTLDELTPHQPDEPASDRTAPAPW